MWLMRKLCKNVDKCLIWIRIDQRVNKISVITTANFRQLCKSLSCDFFLVIKAQNNALIKR